MGKPGDRVITRLVSRVPPLPFALAVVLTWLLQRVLPLSVPFGWPLGLLLLGAGVGLDGWAIVTQLRAGTSPVPAGQHSRLVTWGPYRWTRNPIYIAHTLVVLGVGLAMWHSGWALFGAALAWAVADRVTVPIEETELARLFGAEFAAYTGRVGRWWGAPGER